MEEIASLEATETEATILRLHRGAIVRLSASYKNSNKRTDALYEQHKSALGAQFYIDGTSVTFWIKKRQTLQFGNLTRKIRVGSEKGNDKIILINLNIEPFNTKISEDIFYTKGFATIEHLFKLEINEAINKAVANFKVNLWNIGATYKSRVGKRDENAQSDHRHRIPERERDDGKKKGHGRIRRN